MRPRNGSPPALRGLRQFGAWRPPRQWYTGVRFIVGILILPSTSNVLALSPKVARRQSRTRDSILAESASLFVNKGFANVSVEEIIAAAGIARSSFYRFFANREDVLAQIIRPVFEAGTRDLAEIASKNPRRIMHGIFDSYLDLWNHSPDALRLSTRTGGVHFSLFRDVHNEFRGELTRLLERVERTNILLNGSADFSGRLIARTAVPTLEVYAGSKDCAQLFRQTMSGLLLKPEA